MVAKEDVLGLVFFCFWGVFFGQMHAEGFRNEVSHLQPVLDGLIK